jgi:aromatic ring-opening dioxygenase catalytic subunit (LigB family)
MQKNSVVYLSHGGGPLPLLGDSRHAEMVQILTRLPEQLIKPKAILVISAHWEEVRPTLYGSANPPLYYDYYGFPAESYQNTYPAPAAGELLDETKNRLTRQGLQPKVDEGRGFDHGLFVPLKIMYPQANIPCLQLSLVEGLDPRVHIEMGKALANLTTQDVLIVGSGFSFHNMHAFFSTPTPAQHQANIDFSRWLADTCGDPQLSEPERAEKLISWSTAPGARYCHPREEHLIPLHVCYGAASTPATKNIELTIMDKISNILIW